MQDQEGWDPIGKVKEMLYGQFTLLTDDDLYLFNEGSHFHLYEKLGSHLVQMDDIAGTYFAVWAPDAEKVSVMGSFNGWDRESHPLRPRGSSGIWECFIPGVDRGTVYKYHIKSRFNGYCVDKTDPFAVLYEVPPKTASVVWDLNYGWKDQAWMAGRTPRNAPDAPHAIYEMHIGSWMRVPEEGNRSLTYREMAPRLAEYLRHMGYTHVEFLPVMEHPFYGSWGYESLGYFAPTSRFGMPQDFMALVECLHEHGIGVILDWVPSHFPEDEYSLAFFDGTHLYEHADPRQNRHPDWGSCIFNYGRKEVQSFLISSAFFWMEKYHADGLRVDAVASMLYLDYSRKEGQWVPNKYGTNENLEAVDFIRRFNVEMYKHFPGTCTAAEESTAWSMVSRPTYVGGLGFGMKWDMGWMHDTLEYISKDPVHRGFHHNQLTFRLIYAYHENFILPLSHDEVVHGKGSLLDKMPGDLWQKAANLRLLYGYMYAQPGKKLLFMGGEFGQWKEWSHEESLEWDLLQWPMHKGIQECVKDLNRIYRDEPALHELDFDPAGFEWVDACDSSTSVLSFIRKDRAQEAFVLVILNLTPVVRKDYRIGAPKEGFWREILNSDALAYGGSNQGNRGGVATDPIPWHGRPFSLSLTLPPLGALFLKLEGRE